MAQRHAEMVWWLDPECVVFGDRQGSGIYSERVSINFRVDDVLSQFIRMLSLQWGIVLSGNVEKDDIG